MDTCTQGFSQNGGALPPFPSQQTTMIMQAIRNWLNAENKFYSRLTEESVSNAWVIKFNAGCAVFFFLLMISETFIM